LVRDINRNGLIDDGSELFGDATQLGEGRTAKDGFEALASLDEDGDGWVSASDRSFVELQVWSDADQDGLVDTGELRGLSELGISKLQVASASIEQFDQGNRIGLLASYERTDGSSGVLADVWFRFSDGEAMDQHAASLADAMKSFESGQATRTTEAFAVGQEASQQTTDRRLDGVSQPSLVVAPRAETLGDVLRAYQQLVPQGLPDSRLSSAANQELEREHQLRRRGVLVAPQLPSSSS